MGQVTHSCAMNIWMAEILIVVNMFKWSSIALMNLSTPIKSSLIFLEYRSLIFLEYHIEELCPNYCDLNTLNKAHLPI